MTIRDFCTKIKDSFYGYFENSHCDARLVKMLGNTIFIDLYMAANANEEPHGISQNDMFHCSFSIYLHNYIVSDITEDTDMDEIGDLTLECTDHYILVKPENRYMAYGTVNIPFRKATGNTTKLVTAFDRFVGKLYTTVCDQCWKGNLPEYWDNMVREKYNI